MEIMVKNNGSFKTSLEMDGVAVANSALHKWWKSDIAFKKDNEITALLTKDNYWKFDLSFSKDQGVEMQFKSKIFKDIKLISKEGREYIFKKKGASENRLCLINDQGVEVLVMEKQGKWWKSRPYLVTHIDRDDVPTQDELLPIVIVAAMRIFNQRAAMIAPIAIMMNVVLKETMGE
ncbi:MAG: hypothetical protein RLY35_386 [Bacteroidota bacterium]|jgi:hypothetical protein